VNLEVICQQVVELTHQVGAFISREAASFDVSKLEYKGTNNLVSYVDKEAEKAIIEGLSGILPGAGFIGEEGTSDFRSDTTNWIIDPLDGTTNFVHGLPPYAISIGLLHNGELLIGVVYELNLKECFYAWQGGGAYCNGKQISVSRADSVKDSLIATGFPYHEFGRMDTYLAILKEFMQHSHGVRRLGSAATDLAYVAAGRFEAFYEYNLNAWDVAAGILLVQEAGGKVTDFDGGNDYIFGGRLVASGHIGDEMLKLINKHWKSV
jgi:myo-inositol-1(or 4)-monophosphatase